MDRDELGEILYWLLIGIISLAIFLISLIGIHHHVFDYLLLTLSLVILSRMTYILLTKKRVSVDLLMGTAGLATWYLHAYIEGFLIFTLYAVSELIEEYSEINAKKKLTDLREQAPSFIDVKTGNSVLRKKLDEVVVGDVVLVKPGGVVPVDGVIVEGESYFDTSYITGESSPVYLKSGDRVYSGYINRDRLITVKALRKPADSMLQLLVREAEKALERKASIQKFIEKFSQPYALIVLGIFTLASAVFGLYRGLSILLAGCPSAFILSTSTATAYTITVLSRRSVVVRGGIVLEKASRVKTLVLDKTGTITLGEMRVSKVLTIDHSREELLKLAGAAAKASDHPVSRILAGMSDLIPIEAVEYPGKGVEARVDSLKVYIGSRRYISEITGGIPESHSCDEGVLEVHVALNYEYAGTICLEEKIADETINVIDELKKMNLNLVIASGDRPERVGKIASTLGVKEYYGGLLPSDKKELVAKLKTMRGPVAFVGDGINDVEAIAEADVGIAIGSLRVVSNIGDAILVNGVKGLPKLLKIAKRYMKTIHLSTIIVLTVKLGAMTLGLAGLIPLWMVVGLGDDGSTILSILIISYLLGKTR